MPNLLNDTNIFLCDGKLIFRTGNKIGTFVNPTKRAYAPSKIMDSDIYICGSQYMIIIPLQKSAIATLPRTSEDFLNMEEWHMETTSTPSIIIDEFFQPDFGYSCTLRGRIYGKDIEKLSSNLYETIKDKIDSIKKLTIDISGTHEILFKPARFFAMCDDLNDTLKSTRQGASLELLIDERHANIFCGIEDAVGFNLSIKESSQLPQLDVYEEKKELNWNSLLVYGFSIPLMTACLLAIIGSLIYFSGTLLGFVLTFSSGILAYEGILLIRMLKEKLKENELASF